MANYTLTYGSRFRPFSYAELSEPIIKATQAHQALEDTYAGLADKTDVWNNVVNEAADPVSYGMLTGYQKELQGAADQLAREGLTPNSRQSMMNMRRRYASEITPIETAYKLREEEIKRQQDTLDKTGGNTVFTRDARTTSLDKYLNGSPEGYDQVNLDDVLKYGMAGGKAMSERYIQTSEGRKFRGTYYDLITRVGLNPEQALQVLKNSDEFPEFQRFINDELQRRKAIKGDSPYSDPDRDRIENALMEGINIGITFDEKHSLHDNWMAKLHEQDRLTRNRERDKAIAEQQKIVRDSFNQKILEGIDEGSEFSEDVQRFNGLMPQPDGTYAPEELRTLKFKRNRAYDAYTRFPEEQRKKYEALYNEAENIRRKQDGNILTVSSKEDRDRFAEIIRTMSLLYPKIDAAFAELHAIDKQMEEAQKYYADKQEEFSVYNPSNPVQAMEIGVELKKAQEIAQNYSYALNLNKSSYTEVQEGFRKLATQGRGNVKLIDTKSGTEITDVEKIHDTIDDKTSIGITSDKNGIYLSFTNPDGKRYRIEGINSIDNFHDKINAINNYLKDYSPNAIRDKSRVILTDAEMRQVGAGDITPIVQHLGSVENFVINLEDIGYGLSGTLVSNSLGNREKIIIDKRSGAVIGTSSLADELDQQGTQRTSAVDNYSKQILVELLPKIAHTPQSSQGEK